MEKKLRKVDFTNKDIFIGLDVHHKIWYATILVGQVMNTKSFVSDTDKFVEYLHNTYPGGRYKVAYEAGCFGYWIKEQFEAKGITTLIINPADIPTSDKDRKNKTDQSDSRKIALAIKSGLVKGIYVPSREYQEHRSLSRRRKDLSKKLTRVKNQIKSILKFYGINYPVELEARGTHWSNNFINWLSKLEFTTLQGKQIMEAYLRELVFLRQEILVATKQLRELSKDKLYNENYKLLVGVPGIGPLGAMTILTEVPEIKRFRYRDDYLSYVGLSPNEHSSGESRKIGHMTKRCNHRLRTILIESSWVAIRKDPALTDYFNETYKRIGKQKAIIKVAKKLASRIRYLLINKKEYVIGVAA